ncbi:GAF domain-containing sensor histidine kinase [Bowdeniella massiliensis]|uniref:GAF domain-containing sensor histidine kinase n=1 Tax=Bowdeniella massiliensis TaxID=2932264 RepID=UPI0020278F9A|nr:GAF domain-containing protein [Bowdeniella massiliensis]
MSEHPHTPALYGAALDLAATLETPELLQRFVDLAAELSGARYAALGVLAADGTTVQFVHHGMSEQDARALGHPPAGTGVLGAIPADGALVLDDLTTHPDFGGFPEHHPPMRTFLGVPVTIRSQVFGRLYLAEKPGGFTDHDVSQIQSLAAAAAVAVENSRLYGHAWARQRWIQVSQEITTTLLEGTEEEEALEMIADRVREVSGADTSCIVLPSLGQSWACEISNGYRARDLLGTVFPPDGRALTVLADGTGLIVDSLQRASSVKVEALLHFGSALYAPMIVRGARMGVLILLRKPGRPPFEGADLLMAESVAQQAALALELASARHAQDLANLGDERARIGRDLHDLAIQQLFATGMQLESAREQARDAGRADLVEILEYSLSSVDESVRQIRSIVHRLREPDEALIIVERLRREASLGRTALGYAPSLVISVDGVDVDDSADDGELVDQLDARVDPDIADDVVAVVREGLSNAARHARAHSVQVQVAVKGRGPTGRIEIQVEDDGLGLDPHSSRRSGLDNLAARARRHGGTFSLGRPERGRGTLLSWQAPLT